MRSRPNPEKGLEVKRNQLPAHALSGTIAESFSRRAASAEGMTEDEGDLVLGAEVGEPVPGVGALAGDRAVGAKGIEGGEEGVGVGRQVASEPGVALLVEDDDVHGPCVQVDAAVRCR